MSRSVISRLSGTGVLVLGAVMWGEGYNSVASAASIYSYNQAATFTVPNDPTQYSAGSLFGGLSTGQLVVLNETQVSVETGVHTGTYSATGTLPATFAPSYGPSFLAVAPGGTPVSTKVAAGDGNGDIAVFNPSAPASASIFNLSGDYDAAWSSVNQLAVTNSNGVQLLNTTTKDVSTIVTDIGGASAGIAFDAAGNLYTGDGYYYGSGANQTGLIKEFSYANWTGALASGNPLDFEASGTPIAQLLSAGSLGFDSSGNFFVGGADFFGGTGSYGFNALISASAIQAQLTSTDPTDSLITGNSSSSILRKFQSPADDISNDDAGYWTYNNGTGDLDLRYFGNNSVAEFSAVPEPGSIAILTLGAGITMLRRRKH